MSLKPSCASAVSSLQIHSQSLRDKGRAWTGVPGLPNCRGEAVSLSQQLYHFISLDTLPPPESTPSVSFSPWLPIFWVCAKAPVWCLCLQPRQSQPGGSFVPQGTPDNTWRHFWLSRQVGYYWHLLGKSQGCCSTSYKAQDNPQQKMIQLNMSMVLTLKNSAPTTPASNLPPLPHK